MKSLCILLLSLSPLLLRTDVETFRYTSQNIKEAVKQSKKTKKPILVYYRADWCLPCQLMEETTFTDEHLSILMNSSYITLIMDRDNPASVDWIEKYNICCLPTFQVLDHKGKQISYSEGSLSTPSFYKFLNFDLPQHTAAGIAGIEEFEKVDINAENPSIAATVKAEGEAAKEVIASNEVSKSSKTKSSETAHQLKEAQVVNVEPQFEVVAKTEPIIDETETELSRMRESAGSDFEKTSGNLPTEAAISAVAAHNRLNGTESMRYASKERRTDEIFEVDLTDVAAKRGEGIVYKKEEYIQAGSSRNIKVADRLRERLAPQFENVMVILERDECDSNDVYKVIIGPVEDGEIRHRILSILELKGITGFSKII